MSFRRQDRATATAQHAGRNCPRATRRESAGSVTAVATTEAGGFSAGLTVSRVGSGALRERSAEEPKSDSGRAIRFCSQLSALNSQRSFSGSDQQHHGPDEQRGALVPQPDVPRPDGRAGRIRPRSARHELLHRWRGRRDGIAVTTEVIVGIEAGDDLGWRPCRPVLKRRGLFPSRRQHPDHPEKEDGAEREE